MLLSGSLGMRGGMFMYVRNHRMYKYSYLHVCIYTYVENAGMYVFVFLCIYYLCVYAHAYQCIHVSVYS